jgi:hypothetical protein
MHFWQQSAVPFLDNLRSYRKQGFAAAAGRNCGKSKSLKINAFLSENSLVTTFYTYPELTPFWLDVRWAVTGPTSTLQVRYQAPNAI